VINQYHPGNLCFPCQEKKLEEKITGGEDIIDAEGYASILGLESAESAKRLARKSLLAPRIPGVKKWVWRKNDIDAWFKREQQAGDVFRMTARGIACNLRRCRFDSIICLSLSDKIGSKVYGVEPILGTTDVGRVEPIDLVKVDRSVALNVLEQLSKEDFPELKDIYNWGDLTYDRISEDLIVRLEAYF